MTLKKMLEEIPGFETVEEAVDHILNSLSQRIANLQHEATDALTTRNIETLSGELNDIRADAPGVVAGICPAPVAELVDRPEPFSVDETLKARDDSQLEKTLPLDQQTLEPVDPGLAAETAPVAGKAPSQPAPLPGTGAPAPIPPVGAPVQEFQPQPGAGEAETLQDGPAAPVAASELADGNAGASGVGELVDSLQASHNAAKADPAAAPAPETPAPEPAGDPIV